LINIIDLWSFTCFVFRAETNGGGGGGWDTPNIVVSSGKFKDDVHSVLRISSAHNKGRPPDINIAQILHLSNFFELKHIVYINSFTSIANQKSVRYSISISYFTNIAVQNVNKVRACAQEWTSSLPISTTCLSAKNM
jgi:hypothetical protein